MKTDIVEYVEKIWRGTIIGRNSFRKGQNYGKDKRRFEN